MSKRTKSTSDSVKKQQLEVEEVLIPSGRFIMGSPKSEKARGFEEVQHEVCLTRGFYFMSTDVTQYLWVKVAGKNPSKVKGRNLSVEHVSWYDCVRFANRLSDIFGYGLAYQISGRTINWNFDSNGYRLPTEAEYEYTASGKRAYLYAGSDHLSEVGWFKDNSGLKSHPVALKKANSFGLYDMRGNI